MLKLVDTHCHIHEASTDKAGDQFMRDKWHEGGFTDPKVLIARAVEADVHTLICVGCTIADSQMAIAIAQKNSHCWATIGIHPHEAKDHLDANIQGQFGNLAKEKKVVAVGECGLDYYYTHSPKPDQEAILRFQIELALEHDLPLIFHVREAFADFWRVYDSYKGLKGVVHSFSSSSRDMDDILSRGLYVGLNGIMTFTNRQEQLKAAKSVPLDRLLLETDAPFLTPVPFRGKVGEPKYVRVVAEFLSELRGEPLVTLATATTYNATRLFKLGS